MRITIGVTITGIVEVVNNLADHLYLPRIGRIEIITVLLICYLVSAYKERIEQYIMKGQFIIAFCKMVSHNKITIGDIDHIIRHTRVGGRTILIAC